MKFKPLLANAHAQTIAAALSWASAPPSRHEVVTLPDGDRLVLEVSTPEAWSPTDPTALLVHGLCGSSRSTYMVRLARRLLAERIRTVRMNLRGCGPGAGLAREIYHSGRSEDILEVLRVLARSQGSSPSSLVGFSLGGNLVLKLAGELGNSAGDWISRVVAVSPPVDLRRSAERLAQRSNRLYENMFVRLLRRNVEERHRLFPELGPPRLPHRLSLLEFDELYTAPRCGFRSALDYYDRASAWSVLGRISIPTHILMAEDDPMVDSSRLRGWTPPAHVDIAWTREGGHLGFLARGRRRWMDHWLLERIVGPGRASPGSPGEVCQGEVHA